MNTVELSEKIRDHLTEQKARSINYDGGCCYRGDDDKMCAVGCLITDKVYDEHYIEGVDVGNSAVREAVEDSINRSLTDQEIRLLRDWQKYHDGYTPTDAESSEYHRWIIRSKGDLSPAEFHRLMSERYSF